MKGWEINRRRFLKDAGLGSVALASLPALGRALAADQGNANTTNWIFAAIELANTVNGIQYTVAMEGHGFVNLGTAVGQGSFVEFDNLSLVPHTILASGTWKVTGLTSANVIGTYGSLAAGIIALDIELVEDLPIPGVVVSGVTLQITCNIPAAALFTGEDEGYVLTIPDSPSGPFIPPVVVGGTVFSTENESRGS